MGLKPAAFCFFCSARSYLPFSYLTLVYPFNNVSKLCPLGNLWIYLMTFFFQFCVYFSKKAKGVKWPRQRTSLRLRDLKTSPSSAKYWFCNLKQITVVFSPVLPRLCLYFYHYVYHIAMSPGGFELLKTKLLSVQGTTSVPNTASDTQQMSKNY